MTVGVLSETAADEKRVAVTPEGVKALREKGFDVAVEAGAGSGAGFTDEAYRVAGAETRTAAEVRAASDIILMVLGPSDGADDSEAASLREGSVLVSFLFPSS